MKFDCDNFLHRPKPLIPTWIVFNRRRRRRILLLSSLSCADCLVFCNLEYKAASVCQSCFFDLTTSSSVRQTQTNPAIWSFVNVTGFTVYRRVREVWLRPFALGYKAKQRKRRSGFDLTAGSSEHYRGELLSADNCAGDRVSVHLALRGLSEIICVATRSRSGTPTGLHFLLRVWPFWLAGGLCILKT